MVRSLRLPDGLDTNRASVSPQADEIQHH
jgi:hypothetical protein